MASTRTKRGGAKKGPGAGARKGKTAAKGPPAGVSKAVRAPRARPRAKPRTELSPSQRLALAIAEAALERKAVNVEIIDVRDKVDYTEYVVVMSGTSDRHVAALARAIAEDVEKKNGARCLGREGLPGGAWLLMDFRDVVVHVFHHDVRGYYDLESLWIDAARLPVPGQDRAARTSGG